MKPYHIYCETFMVNYYVSYGVPKEAYRKAVKKYLACQAPKDLSSGNMTIYHPADYHPADHLPIYWIWVEEKDLSCLVHEVFHAVYAVLDNKGVVLCDESEEVFAYQIEMLLRLILANEAKKR